MDVGAITTGDVEWRGGIRVWNVFAREEGNVTVGAVDVFLYRTDSKVSKKSGAVRQKRKDW